MQRISIPFLTLLFLLTGFFCPAENFDLARREIVLRKIGHEILLQAGDSTSRVLPVKKLGEDEYQLNFEKMFAFTPDSLVDVVDQVISENQISEDYIVNVIECSSEDVVFGYGFFSTEQSEIFPCEGREQPINCYRINLKFSESGVASNVRYFLIPGICLLGIALLFFGFKQLRKKGIEIPRLTIGKFEFYPEDQHLILGQERIELTKKESQLLRIFAESLNQVVTREQLQHDVWENEGVIVGRSLDVYISKLRKKLAADPEVRLANVHGKGYRLET